MSAMKEHLFKMVPPPEPEQRNDFESKWTGPDELELTIFPEKGLAKVFYLTARDAGSLADLLNAEVQLQARDLLGEG